MDLYGHLGLVRVLGIGVGCLAAVFGVIGIMRKRIPVIGKRVLTGTRAQMVGIACVIVGVALVVIVEVIITKIAWREW